MGKTYEKVVMPIFVMHTFVFVSYAAAINNTEQRNM